MKASVLVPVLVLLAAACSGGAARTTTPTAGPPAAALPASPVELALDVLPAASRVFIGIDFAALAQAPLGKRLFAGLGASNDPALVALRNCPMKIEDLGSLVIGAAGQGAQIAAIARTPVDETAMLSCMEAMVRPKGARLVKESVAGKDAYHADENAPDDNAWLAWLAPGHFAIAGDRTWLEATLDPAAPKARSKADTLAPALAHVDASSTLWMAIVLEPDERQSLAEAAQGPLASAPLSIHAAIQVTDGVAITVGAVFEGADGVQRGEQLAQGALSAFREQLQPTGYAPLLDDVSITADGVVLTVVVRLEAERVDLLVKLLDQMFSLSFGGAVLGPKPN